MVSGRRKPLEPVLLPARIKNPCPPWQLYLQSDDRWATLHELPVPFHFQNHQWDNHKTIGPMLSQSC